MRLIAKKGNSRRKTIVLIRYIKFYVDAAYRFRYCTRLLVKLRPWSFHIAVRLDKVHRVSAVLFLCAVLSQSFVIPER